MTLETSNFDEVKFALRAGEKRRAFDLLCCAIHPEQDFVVQAMAARLYRSIPAEALELQPLKIALVASSTMDHFADVLRFWLATVGIAAEIYVAPFDTAVQSVLLEGSELYAFQPDIVWLFTTHRDVHLEIPAGANGAKVRSAVADAVKQRTELWKTILSRLNCAVIQNNADCPAYDPFGNFAGVAAWGSRNVLRLYNVELGATALPGVVIYDLDHFASLYGKRQWFDNRYWFYSKHAFSLDAIGLVASSAARLIAAAKGLAKKCLVLDLDNTLWGGVVGDDGWDGLKLGSNPEGEAFVAFQAYANALKERGIILAVCSKNDEANAKEVFERHPDMKLHLADISVFRANWDNKIDNLREIAATLNIGMDSLVFVDDSPAERELVRQFLPMVAAPELPEDPADFVGALASRCFFETVSFSDEDRERARYYRENAQRGQLQLSLKDAADFLSSLQMTAEAGSLDSFHLLRMAQLIHKSNQFHLTGNRYTEAELLAMAAQPDYEVRYFKLRDRFGDNGLVSVLVLRAIEDELHVDTWVMSCRVLSRSMEEFICNDMLRIAYKRGCHALIGCYRPSGKNKLVSGLYEKLGFDKVSEQHGVTTWRRPVGTHYDELTTYVDYSEMVLE